MPRFSATCLARIGLALPVNIMTLLLSKVSVLVINGQSLKWQGRKDSNLRMLESKSSALTNLATPLHEKPVFQQVSSQTSQETHPARG